MARSQEALLKRALKRDIPIEAQRLKDKRKSHDDKTDKTDKNDGNLPVAFVPEAKKIKIANDGSWICQKCKNNNFAVRIDCNRCGIVKTETSIPTALEPKVEIKKVPTQKTKPIIISQTVVKHKKYDWGEQASAGKLEENKLLLAIFKGDKDSTEYQQLTEDEIGRARILIARQARKEVKKAKAGVTKKFLSMKKKQKSASAL